MVKVDQCCCGCSLRTGTIIIGYLYMVSGFLSVIICAVLLIVFEQRDGSSGIHDFGWLYTVILILCVIGIVSGLIQAVVSIFLICGGYEGKPGFLMPWIIYSMIMFILTIFAIFFALKNGVMGNSMAFAQALGFVVQNALLGYSIIVVRSYKESLLRNNGIVLMTQAVPTNFQGQIHSVDLQHCQTQNYVSNVQYKA